MRVRSLRRFYDLAESTFRDSGAIFEVTPERFAEINSHANYGTLVEEVRTASESVPARAPESASETTEAKTTTRRRKSTKKAATTPEDAPQED